MALTQGIGGALPQAMLLLHDDPLKVLLRDAEDPKLLEPGEIDGRDCYRVQITRPDGASTVWIDKKDYLLRRILLPTEEIRQAINANKPVDRVSLVADFTGAHIDAAVDPKAFAFEVPKDAEIVTFFIPPHTAQLLSKKTPAFQFVDLDGKPVTPESLAGKVAVLDFWATWCGPCKQSMPILEQVYEKYKDNPKVAFYAVSVDQPQVTNEEVAKVMADLKVTIPVLRDPEQTSGLFKFTGIPTTFILGADGIVQDYETGGNPKLAEALPEKIEKLLAGENIFEKPLQEYQEQLKQYAKMVETASADNDAAPNEPIVQERQLPQVKTAERSEPTGMKLTSLWKCNDVKSPGNIMVLGDKTAAPRLAVVENWKSIAEIGPDGKLIALHKLTLADNEVIGSLRSAAGADGKRCTVAFLTTQQRCHVLDENWNLRINYPEDALTKPHSGISDVEIGDLDGDGTLEIYVGYWGEVGVQAVSLEGKRIWANRSISNVIGMAIGAPNEKGHRNLYCTNNSGSLTVLNAAGERQDEITIPDRLLHGIVAADLRGDKNLLWCGMTAPRLGENLAIGLTLEGKETWNYPLPSGVPPQPIELIVPGRLHREGPGQWLLPGPDGSVHILAADGKPLDKFNSGVTLHGLATMDVAGQPALFISSDNGVEAWKVE
jgi:thiol-disulfide isomerase/thioredoxin